MRFDELLNVAVGRRAALVLGAAGIAAAAGVTAKPAMYVLGDSWAAGLYADPKRALGQVAAWRLGWHNRVNAVSGTGYLNAGGGNLAYPDRAGDIAEGNTDQVVVLQGGSNDDSQVIADIPSAVAATVHTMTDRFPRARLVMLGPGPDPEPVDALQQEVDRILQRTAGTLGVPYVSMLQEQWITTANAGTLIDPDNHHPTMAGQRYLGARLADSLKRLYPDIAR